jgi:hypothetical protein
MTDHERTELENEVLDLALQWINAKYAVEEALIRQEFTRKIRALKKERRDKEVEKDQQKWGSSTEPRLP